MKQFVIALLTLSIPTITSGQNNNLTWTTEILSDPSFQFEIRYRTDQQYIQGAIISLTPNILRENHPFQGCNIARFIIGREYDINVRLQYKEKATAHYNIEYLIFSIPLNYVSHINRARYIRVFMCGTHFSFSSNQMREIREYTNTVLSAQIINNR